MRGAKLDGDGIQIGPRAPVILECRDHQTAARFPGGHAERPGSDEWIRFALANDGAARRGQVREQIRHSLTGLDDDRLAARLEGDVGVLFLQSGQQRRGGARAVQRFTIVKRNLGPQRESPALEVGIVLPRDG